LWLSCLCGKLPGMELSDLVEQHGGQANLAKALGVNKSHLNRVVRGHRPLGPALAIRIYNLTGQKLGPLVDRS
jgi:plasmid maintenance system antidote protein VapI